jgi:hypothetical protein
MNGGGQAGGGDPHWGGPPRGNKPVPGVRAGLVFETGGTSMMTLFEPVETIHAPFGRV